MTKRNTRIEQATLILIILLTLDCCFLVYAIMKHEKNIHCGGEVIKYGVEAYADADLTIKVDFINWGEIDLTQSNESHRLLWIQNINATVPVQFFLYVSECYPPSFEDWMDLDWNYSGAVVQPNEAVPIDLVLIINDDIVGVSQFSFDIIIDTERVLEDE